MSKSHLLSHATPHQKNTEVRQRAPLQGMFLSAEMEEASLFLGGISSAPHVSPTSSFSLVFPSGQIKYIYHQ